MVIFSLYLFSNVSNMHCTWSKSESQIMKLTKPAGGREIINVPPPPSLLLPLLAVLSSNLSCVAKITATKKTTSRISVIALMGMTGVVEGHWEGAEGGRAGRVGHGHMCKTNLSIIGGSETISGISAINGDTFLHHAHPSVRRKCLQS